MRVSSFFRNLVLLGYQNQLTPSRFLHTVFYITPIGILHRSRCRPADQNLAVTGLEPVACYFAECDCRNAKICQITGRWSLDHKLLPLANETRVTEIGKSRLL